MVTIEDKEEIEGSSDVDLSDQDSVEVFSTILELSDAPISSNETTSLDSSSADLKSHFVGMGFSPFLVDRVIEENGTNNEDLLLEALFTYSALEKQNPEASNSSKYSSMSDINDHGSQIVGESIDIGKRFSLLRMNFLEEQIELAIRRLGESAPLEDLIEFLVGAPETGSSGQTKIYCSSNFEDMESEETMAETSLSAIETRLLEMGFLEDEIAFAIDNLGPEVPIWELADSIFAQRIACQAETREETLDTRANFGLQQLPHESECLDNKMDQPNHSYPAFNTSHEATNAFVPRRRKRSTRLKHMARNIKVAPNSDAGKQSWGAEVETSFGSAPPNEVNFAEPRPHSMELSGQMSEISCTNVQQFLSKPLYFLYGNVVDVSQEMWSKFSTFLDGVEPEYVNSQFFSACSRKEGYIHNLPTKDRFHILPRAPMTIVDALPHTRNWWPSWDTRKQLSSINTETAGSDTLCKRLENIMMDAQGMLSKEQQQYMNHQCRNMNLMWVGTFKLRPIKLEELECILGYPSQHTDISEMESDDRLKALKFSFQTDTLGYHLSVLKALYPDGVKVLSVYSGIGGAEVALHRLGIHLKCVVSIDACKMSQRILKRWWEKNAQSGELILIEGFDKLTNHKLETIVKQFGGFDIVIGANPRYLSKDTNALNSEGVDLSLFFEFVHVFGTVKDVMRRNGG